MVEATKTHFELRLKIFHQIGKQLSLDGIQIPTETQRIKARFMANQIDLSLHEEVSFKSTYPSVYAF